jgi:pimeloyl-ACP methyl ester carboxylesterase
MGGAIGWGLAKYYPKRVTSLIIGGYWAEDLGPSFINDPEVQKELSTLRKGKDAVTKAFVEDLKKEKKTLQKPAVLNRLRSYRLQAAAAQDPRAILAFELALLKERLHALDLLPNLTVPCLMFAGEKDLIFKGAKKACALLQHGRFVSFPGLGHMETWARLDLALPPVLKFLNDVDHGVIK